MDKDILALLGASRDNWERYHRFIRKDILLPETTTIINGIGEYYKDKVMETKIDWDSLSGFLLGSGRTPPGQVSTVTLIVRTMVAYKVTSSYEDIIKSMIEKEVAAKIAKECEEVRDGGSNLEAVHDLAVEGLQSLGRFMDVKSLFVECDITKVVSKVLSTGYEWRLPFLNESLGPLRKGDFVLIAARVEVGKTTFLASEVSHIAQQLGKDECVVWVNNEEDSDKVFFRVVQATLGLTTAEIEINPAAHMFDYTDAMGSKERIRILDGKSNDERILASLFREVKPSLIVFDQLDKVNGFGKAEREDLRLGYLYKWARECAREYGPVLAASQLNADVDTFPDPHYIGMDSLRGSKTDKPGEADAIITIGKYNKPSLGSSEHLIRTINIPKNKMYGGPAPWSESKRHGQFLARIDSERARYHV